MSATQDRVSRTQVSFVNATKSVLHIAWAFLTFPQMKFERNIGISIFCFKMSFLESGCIQGQLAGKTKVARRFEAPPPKKKNNYCSSSHWNLFNLTGQLFLFKRGLTTKHFPLRVFQLSLKIGHKFSQTSRLKLRVAQCTSILPALPWKDQPDKHPWIHLTKLPRQT